MTQPNTPNIDGPTGQLVLRVRGSSRDGQIIRLRSPKCTIGSWSGCTLRIRARGVSPLHCLIVRGDAATVVRRWGPDTLLNGQAFSDAPLNPGDRLQVGPVQFDVLAPASDAETRGRSQAASAPSDPEQQAALWQRIARLEHRCVQRRQRAHRLIGHLREARAEVAALQARLKLQVTEQAALDAQRAELEQSARLLQSQQAELSQRAEKLRAIEAELASKQQELETWEHRLQESARRQEELFVADQPPARTPEAATEESPTQRPSDDSPASAAEVLRRLGRMPVLPEDENPSQDEQKRASRRPRSGGPNREPAVDSDAEEDHDDWVQRHLARLLNQVRAAAPAQSSVGSAAASRAEAKKPDADDRAPEEPPSDHQKVAGQRARAMLAPRAVAPEKYANLDAMRELANLSTRAALDRHARFTLARVRRDKLAVLIVALASAGTLGYFAVAKGAGSLAGFAAVVSLVVGLLWAIQYAVAIGRLTVGKSGQLRWNANRGDSHPAGPTAAAPSPSDPAQAQPLQAEAQAPGDAGP